MNMSTERWKRDDAEIGEKKRKLSTNEKSGSNIAPNKKFRFSEHAEKTLEIFESYFNDKLLTDVTLVTSEFPAIATLQILGIVKSVYKCLVNTVKTVFHFYFPNSKDYH